MMEGEGLWEWLTASPIRTILTIILIIIFIASAIWLVGRSFGFGEGIAHKLESTEKLAESQNSLEISLEKSVIIVDKQSIFLNKVNIKSLKPIKLRLKLKTNSSCISFVDSNTDDVSVTASMLTEVPIKIRSENCYLKTQKVVVEVYKLENGDEEELVKSLEFNIIVTLSDYLNVFPQDGAQITGIFDVMNESVSLQVYKNFLDYNDIIALQNDILFYFETKINAPITIVAKVTFIPLRSSLAQYQTTLHTVSLAGVSSKEFLMGMTPGSVYLAKLSVNKGLSLIAVPQIRVGGYKVSVTFYVLATNKPYDVLNKYFSPETGDILLFTPYQVEKAGMKERDFDEWLKKNALAYKTYHYTLISLSEAGFSSWSSIALFVPYWIDYSGSLWQAINQKKELYILGLLDTYGSLTPAPQIMSADLRDNYDLKTFKDMTYTCCGVSRDVLLVDYTSKQKNEGSPLALIREMLYQDGDYYVILRKMILNEYAVNVDFQDYSSFTDSVIKTFKKMRESDESIYSANLLPVLFFEDNIPLYLKADRIDKSSVEVSDVFLFVCVADTPLSSDYLNKAFVKNSINDFFNTPDKYFSCAKMPDKRYKLVSVSVESTKFSPLVKQYTVKTAFLTAWQVPTITNIDFIRRWFYGHDLACKINHVGLASFLRGKPALDKFVFILLKPDCAEKSQYLTVFYTYTLKIKTEQGRKFNIRVFGGLYYPLGLARERALTELNQTLEEHPDLLNNQTNETESNQSLIDNTTIDNDTIIQNP